MPAAAAFFVAVLALLVALVALSVAAGRSRGAVLTPKRTPEHPPAEARYVPLDPEFVIQIKRARLAALLPALSEPTASRVRIVLAEARYGTIWLNEGDRSGATFTRSQLREIELALALAPQAGLSP